MTDILRGLAVVPVEAPEDDELLPCPFCGGKARKEDLEDSGNEGGSCIACMECGASSAVFFDRKENLESSWNERSIASRSTALERAIRDLYEAGTRLDKYVGPYMTALQSVPEGPFKKELVEAWSLMSDAIEAIDAARGEGK